jgi:hypothetical protein
VRRVEARNGAGDELVSDAAIDLAWHGAMGVPGRKHSSITDRRGRLLGGGQDGTEVVTYAIEVVTAVGLGN